MDKWMEREVLRGLQGLLALRLPGAPAADSVSLMADVWLAAISTRAAAWREAVDAARIRCAFQGLYGTVRQWPTPAEFLAALPAPVPPPALPMPRMTNEERARNRARFDEMLQTIFKKGA